MLCVPAFQVSVAALLKMLVPRPPISPFTPSKEALRPRQARIPFLGALALSLNRAPTAPQESVASAREAAAF